MGIQIYIKKSALDARGIDYRRVENVMSFDYDEDGELEVAKEFFLDIDGMPLLMNDFDDSCWHDANSWGSSRKLIIGFILEHELIGDEEWYEA
jgi:hypothetical protein